MPRRSWVPYVVLFCGVLVASSASILIRLAQGRYGVPSLGIAAWRLGLASVILTPLAWGRAGAELRGVGWRRLSLALLAGVALAVHFASWITSLSYTSVASSAALVATIPLWVGLASLLIFRERPTAATIGGIGLTMAGSALIAFSDSTGGSGSNPLLGDALALLGAVAATVYLLIGRGVGRTLSLLPYIWLVYSGAAVVLLAGALLAGAPLLGYPLPAYAALLGLALGPQLLSHTSFNWSLKYLSATFIAVATLGEPIGSSILAFFFFAEQFASWQLAGFAVLLVGIVAASVAERQVEAPQPPTEPRVIIDR